MIFLQLFYEFFLIGLFAVGGGLATIPFLADLSARTGWFTMDQLTNMIAVSESTPGPLGVNMASYVGYETAGWPGSVAATVGLITPSIIVILIVAAFLKKFRNSAVVQSVFYGLRPASTALIAAAGWSIVSLSLISIVWTEDSGIDISLSWACIGIAVVVFVLTHIKKLKGVHPVVWIALSAIAGIVLGL